MPLINIENLNYNISNKEILSNINFNVKENDIVTFIGPNGAGKSTLLKIIAGILKQTAGKVIYNKKIIKGYVPQHFYVDAMLPMSVFDFLIIDSKKQNVSEITNLVDIKDLYKSDMATLSGGELKKVLLARALLKRPQLLFLDEPTSGLDIASESDFYNTLNKVKKNYDCTILMVSHDLHMVMASSNKVICMNKSICCQGSPSDVMASNGYLKLFKHGEHKIV
ncbi:MAG: Zinc import ATP-binding protein ZnuC [Alphaproteobacteria bacterium ADurb.Bin438]|nr:MAG: Zinc import ATP-binding protein ZnuC [Alphaproteobacteria bacterium ADurb.Bin438]